MRSRLMLLTAAMAMCASAAPALAQSPSNPPPPTAAPVGTALPYLQIAGESDIYEVTSGQVALNRSQNPKVREFASMLIGHHTMTTNLTLAAAKAAGLAPPPAVLGQGTRSMIDELLSAPTAQFDSVYLRQQVGAHEQALAVQTAYSDTGDKAPLRATAKGAIPIIAGHLEHARMLQAGFAR